MLVAEEAEPTLAPGFRGDQPEEPGHERLDRERVDNEDQAEERCEIDIRRVDAENLGDEERGAHGPRCGVPMGRIVRVAGDAEHESWG